MGVLACTLLHRIVAFSLSSEKVRRSMERLILRLIKAGAKVAHPSRRMYVPAASVFPWAHGSPSVFGHGWPDRQYQDNFDIDIAVCGEVCVNDVGGYRSCRFCPAVVFLPPLGSALAVDIRLVACFQPEGFVRRSCCLLSGDDGWRDKLASIGETPQQPRAIRCLERLLR